MFETISLLSLCKYLIYIIIYLNNLLNIFSDNGKIIGTYKAMMQTNYVLECRKENKFKKMKKWMNKRKEVGNGIVNEFGNLDHK